ncbi:MAG: type II toxin-antitoxin system prevent-host-death family antitoxin [Rickettsiales bacterium]|nr:type II toxin-antitoxin system prevent-host-death family antitoxin [Rickettsiales bacterium]MCA0254378.1 type II toxin-antitoxin system prevent-host-death family antitoxin [Pseudomonadota bacterium]
MKALSYTKVRNQLSDVMDHVCEDHDPVIITRQKNPSLVLISLEDYSALIETTYLLQSPKNAERLNQAVSDFKFGDNYNKVDI